MIFRNIFQNNNNQALTTIRIGIWGSVGAGKTIYLTQLFQCLENSNDWSIAAADDPAKEFIQQNKDILDNEQKPGSLPRETDPGINELEIFRYTITSKSRRFGKATIVLEFIDASGEFYENPYSDVQVSNEEKTYRGIIEYLMSCHGIIFLLDPLRSLNKKQNPTYRQLLSNLLIEFRNRSRSRINQPVTPLEQYMAFCVTKVDEEVAKVNGKIVKKADLNKKEYKRIDSKNKDWLWKTEQHNPDSLVTAIMGNTMRDLLSKEYAWVEEKPDRRENFHSSTNRCNFYAVSAFGRYQDKQGKSCTVFEYSQISNDTLDLENENENDSHAGENTEDPDWGSVFGNNPNNKNDSPPDNNPHSSNSQGFAWEVEDEYSNIPDPNKPIIKEGVPIKPLNILEPIEWLIEGIRKHPPILFSDQQ